MTLDRDGGREYNKSGTRKGGADMKKRYDLLILGATALSAGIVAAHPELDIVVLETTSGCA